MRVLLICLTGETSTRLAGGVRHLARQREDVEIDALGVESALGQGYIGSPDLLLVAEQASMFVPQLRVRWPGARLERFTFTAQPDQVWRTICEALTWQR